MPQLRVREGFAQTKNGDVHPKPRFCSPPLLFAVVTKITGSFHVVDVEAAAKTLPPKTKL